MKNNLLGQEINCNSVQDVLSKVEQAVLRREKTIFVAINIHNLLQLRKEKVFEACETKTFFFADGFPIALFLRFTSRRKIVERTGGTDVVKTLLMNSKHSCFILGSDKKVIEKIKTKYKKSVCGYYSPPMEKEWIEEQKQKIINMINKSGAEVVLAALGSPKQELVLVDYLKDTKASVGIGVGSALDIIAGVFPRAPRIMQNCGFEWLWRIVLEPRRLAARYVRDVFDLLRLILTKTIY